MGHITNSRRVVTSTAPPWTINHCRPLRWRRSWLSSPSDGEDPRELAHLPSRKPLAIFMGTSWGFHGGFIVGCCSCCSSRIYKNITTFFKQKSRHPIRRWATLYLMNGQSTNLSGCPLIVYSESLPLGDGAVITS